MLFSSARRLRAATSLFSLMLGPAAAGATDPRRSDKNQREEQQDINTDVREHFVHQRVQSQSGVS